MKDITLIIPAKNESESLPSVLEELKSFEYEIFIILEKSDTKTIESIKEYNVNLIYQTNKGYGDALTLGINSVKTQFFVIFNADGSFNPLEIRDLLNKLTQENNDIVFASRYEKDNNSGSDDDTILTLVGNKIFSFMGNILFSLPLSDILYTFVIGKTELVKKLNLSSKDFRFCVELPIKAIDNKLKICSFASYERKRIAGVKKVNEIKDGFLILFSIMNFFYHLKVKRSFLNLIRKW